MAETYSIATVTRSAHHRPFVPTNLILPDSAALVGSEALAMQQGKQVLCKRADGSLGWYIFDAERSRGTDLVMIPV